MPSPTHADGGVDSGGESGASAAPATEAEAMHMVSRGGVEREMTVAQMQAELGDNHRYSLKADGQDREFSHSDLMRHAQLGVGAMGKMQEAAGLRKQLDEQREYGRTDPAAYLEQHLLKDGMTTRDWMMGQLRGEFEENERINAMRTSGDTAGADRMVEDRAVKRIEGEQKVRETRAQRAEQAKQQQASRRAFQESIPRALEAAGLPHNPATHAHIGRIMQQYQQVGHKLTVEDAAHMARDAYHTEVRGVLAGMQPDALGKFMGDDLRKILREHELAVLKGGGAPAAAPKAATPEAPAAGRGKPKPLRLRDVSK